MDIEENDLEKDRQAMKAGKFTGIHRIPNQNMAMWLTMGPVADRTQDRLGASDLAIVEFCKLMVQGVKDFQQGAPAIGTGDQHIPENVCSFQNMIPKTTDGGNMKHITNGMTTPSILNSTRLIL